MTQRESGYYWVRQMPSSRLEPAHFFAGRWYIMGSDQYHEDTDFATIGPRIEGPSDA